MKVKFKLLLFVFIAFICLGVNLGEVKAVTMTKGDHYTYSSCGLSGEGAKWDYTVYKKIGDDDAYCLEEKVKACTSMELATEGDRHSEPAKIFAGLAWDKVKASVTEDYSSSCKVDKLRYVYMFMLLNTYYNLDPDNINSSFRSTSVNFSKGSKNADIKRIYNEVIAEKKEITSASLAKGSITTSSIVLSSLNDSATTYISKPISITGLSTELMGKVPTYTLKVTANGDATPTICSKGNGTGCSGDTVTITGAADYNNFYIKVDNASADTVVTATLKGNVCREYSKMEYYYKGGGCQDVARNVGGTDQTCKESNVSRKFTVKVKTDKYSVSLYKYDEDGNDIDDAEFTMTIGGEPVNNLVHNGHIFSVSNLDSLNSGTEICYTETKIPSGFIKPERISNCFTVPERGSSVCYDGNGNSVEDQEYCKAYQYMCKDTNGEYKNPNAEGKCMIETSSSPVCYQVQTIEGLPFYFSQDIPANNCDSNPGDGYDYVWACPNDDANNPQPVDSSDATCTSSEVEVPENKTCVISNGAGGYTVSDNTAYCDTDVSAYTQVNFDDNDLALYTINTKNSVSISKKALTGDNEVPGATLKICTKESYDSSGNNCEIAQSVDKKDLKWVSTFEPKIINGVPKGDYYVVETLPPDGYMLTSNATSFSIDDDGNVKVDNQVTTNPLVIHNTLNKVVISKTDLASSKEVPGAKMAICLSTFGRTRATSTEENAEESVDESGSDGILLDASGDCIPAIDAEGNETTWTSGTSPHEINGLPAGTYYLVETMAPDGYATAEAIQFTMSADGKITDKNGKSLADNKLVMKDATINQVKTGRMVTIIALVMAIVAVGLGSYYVSGHKISFAGINLGAKIKGKKDN